MTKELGRVALDRVRGSGRTLPDTGAALSPTFLERLTGWPSGSIRSIRVLDEHHGTAGRVRVAIDTPEGSDLPATLFVKMTPQNLTQRVMMNVFDLGEREVLFYSAVAADAPVRVPHCYGVELDPGRGRNVMVLEDLSTSAVFRDIRQPASAEEAGAVVDAFADLHAAFWQSPRFAGDLALLRRRPEAAERLGNMFVRSVLGKLKGRSAEVVPDRVQAGSRILFERKAELNAYWARQPQTLCHGDSHFGNLFFEGAIPGFLDWQAVMAGPGIRDIAYFLVASVDVSVLEPIERDLVDRYVARLSAGGMAVDAELTWTHYRAAASEFYISAVVTAGTSDRMQPPEISNVGVDRVVAAMQRLDTFDLLAQLLDDRLG